MHPGERGQRDARAGDVGRLGVVDVQHAPAARHLLQAVRDAGEAAQAGANRVGIDAPREADGGGGHRVLEVVGAPQAQLAGRQQLLPPPPQAALQQRAVGLRAGAEADLPSRDRRLSSLPELEWEHRDVLALLAREDLQLGLPVGLEGSVAVQVVGAEIEQDGRLRSELERVLQLEGGRLADHDGALLHLPHQTAQGNADVARDEHRQRGLAVDVRDQLDRRGLAVRPGDREELVAQQAPGKLKLAEDRQPARTGGRDHGRPGGHTGALDHRTHALELCQAVLAEVQLDPLPQGLPNPLRIAGVHADHPLTEIAQQARRGDARAREPDDQVGALWNRRPGPHRGLSRCSGGRS